MPRGGAGLWARKAEVLTLAKQTGATEQMINTLVGQGDVVLVETKTKYGGLEMGFVTEKVTKVKNWFAAASKGGLKGWGLIMVVIGGVFVVLAVIVTAVRRR